MLKQRVITALILVGALILIVFRLPAAYAVICFAGIAALAAWEWDRFATRSVVFAPAQLLFPLWVGVCCWFCLQFPQWQQPLCLLSAVFWLLVPLWLAKRWPMKHKAAAYLVGTIVIVPTWIAMMRLHAQGPWVLMAAMALVWVADISAYFVGRAFGKHKLAPAVSPGKTWEGAGGAVAGGLLYVFLLRECTGIAITATAFVVALGTVVLVAVSIIGDLFESMIKRQTGVKDSSQLLPGHGGVLDRIDSLTSTLPVLVAVISLWSAWGRT